VKIRTKKVTIDGAEYTISPLTVEQVDAFNQALQVLPKLEDLTEEQRSSIAKNPFVQPTFQVIAWSFNNVYEIPGDTDSAAHLTASDIPRKMDNITINFLRDEILSFSGLNYKTAETKPGEAPAAKAASST
jgi:hypothetical protein